MSFDNQGHTSLLLELGFPKNVAKSAGRAVENGLFDLEPSPELVKKTVDACKAIVASSRRPVQALTSSASEIDALWELLEADTYPATERRNAPALTSVARLVAEYAAMVEFVHDTGRRPMCNDNLDVRSTTIPMAGCQAS